MPLIQNIPVQCVTVSSYFLGVFTFSQIINLGMRCHDILS